MGEVFDVLVQWLSGTLSPNYELWVLTLRWWGRIGKFVSFLAAMTLIAEIAGYQWLEEFSKSPHVQGGVVRGSEFCSVATP